MKKIKTVRKKLKPVHVKRRNTQLIIFFFFNFPTPSNETWWNIWLSETNAIENIPGKNKVFYFGHSILNGVIFTQNELSETTMTVHVPLPKDFFIFIFNWV